MKVDKQKIFIFKTINHSVTENLGDQANHSFRVRKNGGHDLGHFPDFQDEEIEVP